MIHSARLIPIDAARPHVGENIRQWNGDSRGHWEGNTLVVETTNFNDQVRFRNSTRAVKVDRALHARGRRHDHYTLHRGRSQHVDAPVDGRHAAVQGRRDRFTSTAATKGNYGLPNILRAQRVEDQKNARPPTTD